MSKKAEPERIALTFDLLDLPTAQHRAGLAGLILQIDSMGSDGNQRSPSLVPAIREGDITPNSATIEFTRESMQGVFDDVYAAETVPVVVAKKWPGATKPKPGEYFIEKRDDETGELKRSPGFGYDVVQPLAPCLHRHIQPEARAWITLWRQMIWEIPRGGNNVRSRVPFEERAADKPCNEGSKAWTQINKFLARRAKSRFETGQISGALLLGAQAFNAEGVPFSGRADHNLLLHFWQVVALAFMPRAVEKKKDGKTKRVGYVVTIPDVANLLEFRREFPRMLGRLAADPRKTLPPSAWIDQPGQANLEVLLRMKGGVDQGQNVKVGRAILRSSRARGTRGHVQATATDMALAKYENGGVHAVESYHMVKSGNNIKMLSFARVVDREGLTDEYQQIDRSYRNPLFRAARIGALIRGGSWHAGMIELFAEYPWPFFIESDDTPKYLARFGRDANDQLRAAYLDIRDMKLEEMNKEQQVKYLSVIIRRLIDKYVEGRAEAKTGMKVKEFPKKKIEGKGDRLYTVYPADFRKAQQGVCSDAFLAMRSRHDQDFVGFFAGSICSVAQYLSPDEYQFLIGKLMTRPDPNPLAQEILSWEDVKAIAMIAVSACAYVVRPRETEK